MNYSTALEYIHSVTWKGSRLGLERIEELCEMLGHPENSLRFIHVAGTNGKGSVCRALSSILEKEGYNVGLYTSPFVESFNERIMYNGKEISNDELVLATEKVKLYAERMKDSPTEFELITAIAFVFFKKMNCDFVVLEAGLGGRLDSTNVITTAVLSIITGIDLDHTAILGDTTAKIAAEKAGIIKHNTPVLFGEGDEDAQNIIKKTALERRCTFYRTDFSKIENIKSDLNGTSFDFGNHSVKIGLHGLYQTRNMATVCTAVEILRENGISISDKAVSEGFLSARWKARFEILNESPLIIYDGAHNPQGIAGAVENISHYLSPLTSSGRVLLLMGVMADKDFHKMISMLSPLVEQVFCVTPDNSRSLESGMVEKEFEQFNIKALSFDKLNDGVFEACRTAENKNIPLICLGSLYMYADVKKSIIKYFNL